MKITPDNLAMFVSNLLTRTEDSTLIWIKGTHLPKDGSGSKSMLYRTQTENFTIVISQKTGGTDYRLVIQVRDLSFEVVNHAVELGSRLHRSISKITELLKSPQKDRLFKQAYQELA